MAHQTGIEPSSELLVLLSKALKGSLRFVQVQIREEKLVPGSHSAPKGSWEEDLDKMLQPVLKEDEPCYIFYRLDTYNVQKNYLWVFMAYTPDFAQVRQKMLYSATKASLRKAFDSSSIVDDIAASSKSELTLTGYRKFLASKEAAPPLTEAEQERKEYDENQKRTEIGTSTRQSHLHGVAFPLQPEAMDAITNFANGRASYVQLSIDVKSEVINLGEQVGGNMSTAELSAHIPDSSPRYHLYLYKHSHEGDYQEAIVFLYSCPGFSSSIRERMLYSSCKEPVVSAIEQEVGQPITKKIEISDGSDISEAFLMEEIHPKKTIVRSKFLKPKGPASRRPKSPNKSSSNTASPGSTSPPSCNSPVNGEN